MCDNPRMCSTAALVAKLCWVVLGLQDCKPLAGATAVGAQLCTVLSNSPLAACVSWTHAGQLAQRNLPQIPLCALRLSRNLTFSPLLPAGLRA